MLEKSFENFFNPDVLKGCDAVVSVREKSNLYQFGWAQSFDITEEANQKPIRAISFYKPRGSNAMFWNGTLDMEIQILTQKVKDMIRGSIGTVIDANTPIFFTFKQKSTGLLVYQCIGFTNTSSWNLATEDLSLRKLNMQLVDSDYKQAFSLGA